MASLLNYGNLKLSPLTRTQFTLQDGLGRYPEMSDFGLWCQKAFGA